MESIGIDLGAAQSHVSVCDDNGVRVTHQTVKTAGLGQWLKGRPPSRVVMESCTQSRAVAALAKAAQHTVVVVPAHYMPSLGVGRRGIKTDKKDAEVLAHVGHRNQDLPSVYQRGDIAEAWRELMSARDLLIENRTRLALHLKSTLRGRLIHVVARANPANFTTKIRDYLLADPSGLSNAHKAMLQSYDDVTAQIEQLNDDVHTIAKQDAVCQRLMTVPGVGPVVSLALVSHLDDAARFGSSDELGSYLALVPGEMTTGGKIKRTGILRAGPGHIKALLVQAAWSMWRARPDDELVLWARALAARRGKRIAIVALARKMATILWAMWRHGTDYQAQKAAQPLTETQQASLAPVPARKPRAPKAPRTSKVRKADTV
jgi:transposase